MKYYKAKMEADQVKIKSPFASFIISGELFTEKEISKTNLSARDVKKYFDIVMINKNNTYYFFGSRRYK